MINKGKISIISNTTKQIDKTEINININKEYRYTEKNNTKVIFNSEKNVLIRNNEDIYMKYIFKEGQQTTGSLNIKSLNKNIKVVVYTKNIIKEGRSIEIEYQIEDDIYIYKIEMEW